MKNNKPYTALITGAARRIGLALAQTLHTKGWNVIIHHCASDATNIINQFNHARPNSAKAIQANLNKTTDVLKLAKAATNAFDTIDVLINNASSFYPTSVGNTTEDQWHDLINTNLKAPFFLSQALAPALKARHGCIINMADIYAERPLKKHAVYSIAKAGNTMLTQALALELAPDVRVNGIAPGAILWPEGSESSPEEQAEKLSRIPMGKIGGTEPITEAALHLINHAPYTTGQIITIDGGKSLSL